MSIYMYTLRKTNSLTLEYIYNGVKLKFPVYRFKFAFGNCSWDHDYNLIATGTEKAKMTRAEKTFGDKPVLVTVDGDIFFQDKASPVWCDCFEKPHGKLVGEIRTEHPETGEQIKEEPFFCGIDEKEILEILIKEYYPNLILNTQPTKTEEEELEENWLRLCGE